MPQSNKYLTATKTMIKRGLPSAVTFFRRLRSSAKRMLHRRRDMKVFTQINQHGIWGVGESVSGSGSAVEATKAVRERLPSLMHELRAESILDAPCGDFNWMRYVKLDGIHYIGADVVESVIDRCQKLYGDSSRTFMLRDITAAALPRCDLIMSRDCLVHLSYEDIHKALRNFRESGATYLLTTHFTFPRKNWDIATGDWRPLNLLRPPFSFGPPMEIIVENCAEAGGEYSDKSLGLWRIADLKL